MKGFSSKRIAFKVNALMDQKICCLQARPCIFQPGNFTGWAVKRLILNSLSVRAEILKLEQEDTVRDKHNTPLGSQTVNSGESQAVCIFVASSLPLSSSLSECLRAGGFEVL